MEETLVYIRDLKRHLNSIEHMIYVSCKFTRTTEMLRRVMETIVATYEQFFRVASLLFVDVEEFHISPLHHRIQMLNDALTSRGINVDLSDYFLLKKLLMSEFDSIGEYRKNLCMVSYIDGEEYVINVSKLLEFYDNLKTAYVGLSQVS